MSSRRRHPAPDRLPDDLTAALGFTGAQGTKRVVLVGASLGAAATIKVAAAVDIAAAR
jgi:dienelactone hydrolase